MSARPGFYLTVIQTATIPDITNHHNSMTSHLYVTSPITTISLNRFSTYIMVAVSNLICVTAILYTEPLASLNPRALIIVPDMNYNAYYPKRIEPEKRLTF